MTLSGTNDLGASITATVTTAANGTYSFSTDSSGNALRPGTYQVVETPPSNYLTATATVGKPFNLVAFTPGTSFDKGWRTGKVG